MTNPSDSEGPETGRPPEPDIQPCEICEWPVLKQEGFICACCGFEQGYDDPATYKWNGEWWAKDKSRMPKILLAALPAGPETGDLERL